MVLSLHPGGSQSREPPQIILSESKGTALFVGTVNTQICDAGTWHISKGAASATKSNADPCRSMGHWLSAPCFTFIPDLSYLFKSIA